MKAYKWFCVLGTLTEVTCTMIRTNEPYLAEKNRGMLHQLFEGTSGTRNLKILYRRLAPISLCAGFTREESSDIFSETLLSMVKRGISGYDGELREGTSLIDDPYFSRYICGVFIHHMRDYNERKKVRPDIASNSILPQEQCEYDFLNDSGVEYDMGLKPDQQAMFNETLDITLRAFSSLGGIEAAILKMKFGKGLDLKEIARRFELHPVAIGRLYLNALTTLWGHFPEDYDYGLKLSR